MSRSNPLLPDSGLCEWYLQFAATASTCLPYPSLGGLGFFPYRFSQLRVGCALRCHFCLLDWTGGVGEEGCGWVGLPAGGGSTFLSCDRHRRRVDRVDEAMGL